MDNLLNFAHNATPTAVLGIAVGGLVYVIFKTYKGENTIDKISDTQDEKYPHIEELLSSMKELSRQNQSLLENHFKHEIPDMKKAIDRTEASLKDLNVKFDSLVPEVARLKAFHEK